MLRSLAILLILTAPVTAQFLGRGVAEWSRDLESGDVSKRRAAAFALGKLGPAGAAATDVLKHTLASDPDPKVREAAAYSLGEISLRVVVLGKDRDLLAVLTKSLRDRDPLVRRSSAYALGCLGADAAGSRKDVETALQDDDAEVRQTAAWSLGRLGDEAIPALKRVLADKDALVLRDAAASLGQLDPEAGRIALTDLARLASHSDVEVKKAALLGLVRIVGPEDAKSADVFGPLHKALIDGDDEVRRNAAFALSNIGGATAAPAVDVLLDTLKIGDLEVKRQAAAAFRNVGSSAERAVPELIACLQESDGELRSNAALALGGIGRKSEPAVVPLVALVGNRTEPGDIRVKAAVALSMIGDVKPAVDAAPKLLYIVVDPKEEGRVRERVMWALRVHAIKLRDMPGVLKAFLQILNEPATNDNRMVRLDCAYLTGMVFGPKSPPDVFPVLLEYLKDDTLQVYRNTSSAVSGAAQETTAGKASSRELGDGDGRKLALDALGSIGPTVMRGQPDILAEVRRLADSDRTIPSFRKQCRDYLRTVGP